MREFTKYKYMHLYLMPPERFSNADTGDTRKGNADHLAIIGMMVSGAGVITSNHAEIVPRECF